MTANQVSFPARGVEDAVLEGRLLEGDGRPCVVTHPHPLHGGDMDHPVVVALWRAAADAGLRALRFNFRGVGRSGGRLTERSPLATADLGGAIDFLGGGPVLAAGYSYGARTILHAIHAGEAVERAVLVALPTRLPSSPAALSNLLLGRPARAGDYETTPDLDMIGEAPVPVRVVAGDRDALVSIPDLLDRGVEPDVIPGVNHFFSRRLGSQGPLDEDLELLCRYATSFLFAGP